MPHYPDVAQTWPPGTERFPLTRFTSAIRAQSAATRQVIECRIRFCSECGRGTGDRSHQGPHRSRHICPDCGFENYTCQGSWSAGAKCLPGYRQAYDAWSRSGRDETVTTTTQRRR
ncbi:zinc ribbon domain-containing protein [Streptomyces sp. NPDC126514]|uniref:zinc ribbon domain-containing protein n=1 Tax=Streptomyces sp. NPDC126514 TaxID=3155210 RepID=UPI003323381D